MTPFARPFCPPPLTPFVLLSLLGDDSACIFVALEHEARANASMRLVTGDYAISNTTFPVIPVAFKVKIMKHCGSLLVLHGPFTLITLFGSLTHGSGNARVIFKFVCRGVWDKSAFRIMHSEHEFASCS